MMQGEKIRTGLIGYGLSGSVFHAPLIRAVPDLELLKVVTGRRRQVTEELPDVLPVEKAEELFDDPGIDLVVVTTPNRLHYVQAKKALEAGKHVVVEKPFTLRVDEAWELTRLAEAKGLFLSVFHNRRWDSGFLTLRRYIGEGRLGEVHTYRARFDRFRPEVRNRWKERDPEGGGTLYDLGSHLIDQALLLFGEPRTVWADVRNQRVGSTTPDWFHLVLQYENGRRVILDSGSMVLEPGPTWEVHGTRGSYIQTGMDSQEESLKRGLRPGDPGWGEEPAEHHAFLTESGEEGLRKERVRSLKGRYETFYRGVRDAIREGRPAPVTPVEATRVIRVIERAIQSSRTGQVLPY
ncbi:scyllo-inositol 2-dehydrogenase (NADP+) [Melghirimyces profundicolus]|uniref:Scyllo-inositol 2-dehydrogenase (NADP+) n=1 Tax=Melghirimyces profundicolus TaxID=1242148 RepID=A0A2T6BS31_9BACL|nr:oxidoreductase [Melghirimyces profundicolus]PTX58888.1 scyllo-inositol 2-dehydrogenase (NADP+) [Melghirimyces profundicolus]